MRGEDVREAPVTARARILMVDDDPTVSDVVGRYLRREGYAVESVADGRIALQRATEDPPDLVLLDLMIPGVDGLEVCRRLRAILPVPVIMLTAKGDESDRVLGLELGADDYVAKPFSPRELVARVKAVLRRARAPLVPAGAPPLLRAGDIEVDVAAHEARVGGEPAVLTAREL